MSIEKNLFKCAICNNIKEFAIIFDIPANLNLLKVKTNRILKAMEATLIQKSVWKCKDFDKLLKLAVWIREHGGRAEIIEWKPLVKFE